MWFVITLPPPFSAKKIGGKKFYELARAGEPVPDTPKKVTVRSLEILGLDGAVARFRVACTTGTYIRSLAHDIGRALGTGAHLGSLRRTSIGPFRLEDARTLPALEALPREERFGKPSWMSLSEIPLPFPVAEGFAQQLAQQFDAVAQRFVGWGRHGELRRVWMENFINR